MSEQSFMLAAIEKALDDRANRKQEQSAERARRRESRGLGSMSGTNQPMGLGLRRSEPLEPLPAPEPTQAPVIVNVGGAVPASGGEVGRLAAWVTAGREYERDMRKRTAVEILRASSANDEERLTLAAQLDAAIAKRTKEPPSLGGLLRGGGGALDMLKGLLGS